MSESAPKLKGRAALDEELARYTGRNVTLRVCDALLRAIPGGPETSPIASLDALIASHQLPEPVAARAVELAGDKAVDRVLFAAKSIDTGDTGITILTGVRTALSLWLGADKGPGAGADAQQRADAALKALGIAYLATQLIPREPEQRVACLKSLDAGRALILYYAAVEIALPFGPEAATGHYVADLVEAQSRKIAGKLLGVIGREGVSDAQETLAALTGELDRAVMEVAPHADSLADSIKGMLPKIIGSKAAAVSDVVAAGADALPSYRFLTARLAAESRIALARWEADPESEPVPEPEPEPAEQDPAAESVAAAPSEVLPPPPAVPAALAASSMAVGQLQTRDPMSEPSSAAPDPDAIAEVPAEEAEVDGDVPPGEHDLNGVYQRTMPWGVLWLVFTRDGVFANHPPARPDPDWVAHAEAGHQVGTYQHRADQLEIRWPNGKTTTSTFRREATSMTVDGQQCTRCDWNLDGHAFQGTWQSRDGDDWLTASGDGRFDSDRGAGRYTLGVGAVELSFADGTNELSTLYSTLEPDSGAPDTLWIAGRPYDRTDAVE